jgi:T5SS/PEP-CTERM-associated repeat protein/autotransporter passenger strand-loop-strand repeat protein
MTTTILSGVTSSGLTIGDGDFLLVSSGGVASLTMVLNGGTEDVFRGGMVSGSVVSGGGTENVSSGGVATDTVLMGGEQTLFFSGSASGTEVSAGGIDAVSAGGITNFVTVSSGGVQYLFAGGQADGTTVSASGLEILFGGLASGSVLSGDGIQDVRATGAVASATIVTGEEYVYSGGVAIGSVVSLGGFAEVESNGTVSDVTIGGGGTEFVYLGGVASGSVVEAGGVEVVSGGVAVGTTVDSGGAIDVAYLPYASGGSAGVTSSGLLTVSVGGGTYTQQLSGSYIGETFQLTPDAGSGTLLTLSEAPRTLVWTGSAGTGFSAAANWDDVTNDLDPALSAPGEFDTAEFLTGGGSIGGAGSAAALLFGGLAQWVLGASSTLTAAGSAGVTVGGLVSLTSGATIVSQGSTDAISGQGAEVTVTGIGSTWDSDGALVVGGAGLGGLAIQAGGAVNAGAGVVIANTASADGSSVELSGAGSDLQVTGLLDVGVDGSGGLSISDGASVTAGTLDAGDIASAVANISVTGADFTVSGSATVAGDGTGVMSVLSGASFAAADLTIGSQGDSSGALVVSGDGSVVNISGDLNVGTALGTGDLTIGPGATVNALVVNLRGEVVLENGELDPTVIVITQGQTAGSSGTIAAGDIVDDGVIQAGGSKPSEKLLVVTGTILGGEPWSINGTAQPQVSGSMGVLQINAGGTLELTGPVSNAGSTTFTDDVTPQGTYTLNDSVVDVNFADATGVLKLDDIAGFSGTIAAVRKGDEFVVTGGTLSGLGVTGGDTLTVSDSGNGGTDRLIFASAVSASGFSIVNNNTIQVACFAAGTRIATEAGLVAVEDLAIGDRVITAGGTLEPVVWLGQRTVNCKRHPKPETVWPVRVRAGALGRNVPVRDLYLSPDHAVFISDVLIPVSRLINGTSIARVKRDRITYYHVELPRHAVILAEGLTVESYLDLGDRRETIRLFPDFGDRFTPDAAMVWETKGAAPLVLAGDKLAAARRWVTESAPGWTVTT